jgi:hypothetical protein
MKLWVLTAILFALAVAGCGPDCDRFCSKIAQCERESPSPAGATPQLTTAECVLGCNDSGGDRSATIQCYIDHTCPDIRAGHCKVTGEPFPAR